MAFNAGSSDTENIRMGTCVVILNGTELGFTKGGVELEVQTDSKQIMVDQFGQTPVAEYIMGRTLTVKCPMAETSVSLIASAMPGTTLYSTGGEKVEIKSGTGISLLDLAKTLILRPKALHDIGDESEDFIIPKAAAPGSLQFAYKYDEERIFNLEFKGYPVTDADITGGLTGYSAGTIAAYGLPTAS